jgi:CubicO group peptidase (beta-lactamase class C family)
MLNARSDSWLDCGALVLVAAMFLATSASVQAGDTAPLRERLRLVMSDAHGNGDFDGAVLVAVNGEIAYQGAFGLADAEWNIPNTAETHFGIASLTKSFTAHLVLALADRKQLSLDVVSVSIGAPRLDECFRYDRARRPIFLGFPARPL